MIQEYPHGHHESVLRGHRWRTVSNSAAYLLGSLRPDMAILDVGCGPGSITVDLASMVPQGKVIGLDTTSDPFEEGLKLAAERSIANVSFKVGDAKQIPFPDKTFDMVHAHQVLQYLNQDDRLQAIREMRRVAKSGGLVCMREADQGTVTFYPELDGLNEFVNLYLEASLMLEDDFILGQKKQDFWQLISPLQLVPGATTAQQNEAGGVVSGSTELSNLTGETPPSLAAMPHKMISIVWLTLGVHGVLVRTLEVEDADGWRYEWLQHGKDELRLKAKRKDYKPETNPLRVTTNKMREHVRKSWRKSGPTCCVLIAWTKVGPIPRT
ncbi:MAG: hypothetical protein Q9205_001444 [Flavoplaca limonia]